MAKVTLPQLQRISPSSADELERCPWAWSQLRVQKTAARLASRPMVRGSVFHDFVDRALRLWLGGEEIEPALLGRCIGEAASGLLNDAERAELDGAVKWFRPPCDRGDVIVVEPCSRVGNGPPSPIPSWAPVKVDGFSVWGIPDVVHLDQDGRPVILDWKTGYMPKDPAGFAPGVYGAMLACHWASLVDGVLAWPIRVTHRFVMLGQDKGTRTKLFSREDVDREIGRLEALVHTAQGWHDSGKWPCLQNEYCASCPFLGECPAWEGAEPEDVAGIAEQWLRLDAEGKRAEAEQAPLADMLKAAAAAGTTVAYPDGKTLAITNGSVSWRLRSSDDMAAFLAACDSRGLDPIALLTIDGRAASQMGLKDDDQFARFRTPADEARVTVRRVNAS